MGNQRFHDVLGDILKKKSHKVHKSKGRKSRSKSKKFNFYAF